MKTCSYSHVLSLLLASSLSLNVIGCSGNEAPVAQAGNAISAKVDAKVSLDGSKSSDADGDKLTFKWSLAGPSGSTAKLDDAAATKPSFTPDKEGEYTATLIVNDGKEDSSPATVKVTVTPASENAKPTADAGAGATVKLGDSVALDGSGSNDPDGDTLTYKWELTSKPEGSTAALDDATKAKPSFVADKEGDYAVKLIVNDGKLDSDPVSITITATDNAKPIADPGGGFVTALATSLTLDGSASSDPEEQPLTYKWTISKAPTGSTAALDDDQIEKPSLTPDKEGEYEISLVVNDGKLDSDAAKIRIVAQAGTLTPLAAIEAPATGTVGAELSLSGARSLGPKGATLEYAWTIKSAPATSAAALSDADKQTAKLTPDVAGDYVFELVVSDGTTESVAASATVTIN